MRIRYAAACLAACAALSLGGARAEWYVFEADNPPEALLDAAMQVSGFAGEVTLSFLGDCTLGGESKAANSRARDTTIPSSISNPCWTATMSPWSIWRAF